MPVSAYFTDPSHIPTEQRSRPLPVQPVPRKYFHHIDLFAATTAVAETTRRIRIGSGVCLAIQPDPITTAKEVASIDVLSGGRFDRRRGGLEPRGDGQPRD